MGHLRLLVQYDGTDFEGWQEQPGEHRTVQGCLRAALVTLARRPAKVALVGAGRTDAGVHARGQVAHATLDTRLEPRELLRALNALLPTDLAVCGLAPAAPGFHARRDARSKHYRYRLWTGRIRAPLCARFAHHVPARLDVTAMQRAARAFIGTHDFRSLCAAGSRPASTLRNLSRVAVEGELGGELSIEVEGDGFLRHMVRNLVGTLLEVGRGHRGADSIPQLLAQLDRSAAGPTAPARGLQLVRVDYGRKLAWDLGRLEAEVDDPA